LERLAALLPHHLKELFLPRTNTSLRVDLKKNTLDAVRYAAYSVSGEAYVLIAPLPKGGASVEFTPKPGAAAGAAELKRRFLLELSDEKLRERISIGNRELREFLLLKSLNYRPAPAAQDDSGLTPRQEKELNDLIAQIEGEIKAESAKGAPADPLGITSTWEDRYDTKNSRKKKR
jgi:hypothetical protein